MAERVINIIGLGDGAYTVGDTGENWVLNVAYKKCKKVDKMFFMDDFKDIMNDDVTIMPEYTFKDFLKDNPNAEVIGKFAQQIVDDKALNVVLGNIKEYPINEATRLVGGIFFTSTIAYTIAYAIMEKVDRIRLYGMEIYSGSDANEYTYQAPCVDFWLAFAQGRGIKVEVPHYLLHTMTNNQNLYGYAKGELKKIRRKIGD